MENFVKLSKEEMKMVIGGTPPGLNLVSDTGEGGGSGTCGSGPCSETIISGNTSTTNYGQCEIELYMVMGKQEGRCRCSAIGGDQITSNGGVSRCLS